MADPSLPRADETEEWRRLSEIADALSASGTSIRSLFEADGGRFAKHSLSVPLGGNDGELLFDYSKQLVTDEVMDALFSLADARGVPAAQKAMRSGDRINFTEQRAVLHVALRAAKEANYPASDDIAGVLSKMRAFADGVRGGAIVGSTGKPFTDVLSIGIGGSDLGPAMAVRALSAYASGPRVHFVSNVDGASIATVTAGLDRETTLVLVASKTFTTQETLKNAASAKGWMTAGEGALPASAIGAHFAALSTNASAVAGFGIDPESRMFPFWDFVGGRYSMWSAIGLPIALAVGFDAFEELLAGAADVDTHFFECPARRNVPLVKALLTVWNTNFLGANCLAVLPYDEGLSRLPAYLQQLSMESNGKSVDAAGRRVRHATGPVVFGEPGTNGQHSFYQLLHQGRVVPCDFIAPAVSQYPAPPGDPQGDHHRILLSNFLAQPEALMMGKTTEEVKAELAAAGVTGDEAERLALHKTFEGNRPTTSIVVGRVTPRTLGAIIAMYEHCTFVEGVLWGINSFDQWGVELGKQLAKIILPEIDAGSPSTSHDSSTNGLIDYLNTLRRNKNSK